jgi:hypothetical protein
MACGQLGAWAWSSNVHAAVCYIVGDQMPPPMLLLTGVMLPPLGLPDLARLRDFLVVVTGPSVSSPLSNILRPNGRALQGLHLFDVEHALLDPSGKLKLFKASVSQPASRLRTTCRGNTIVAFAAAGSTMDH